MGQILFKNRLAQISEVSYVLNYPYCQGRLQATGYPAAYSKHMVVRFELGLVFDLRSPGASLPREAAAAEMPGQSLLRISSWNETAESLLV